MPHTVVRHCDEHDIVRVLCLDADDKILVATKLDRIANEVLEDVGGAVNHLVRSGDLQATCGVSLPLGGGLLWDPCTRWLISFFITAHGY